MGCSHELEVRITGELEVRKSAITQAKFRLPRYLPMSKSTSFRETLYRVVLYGLIYY